MVIESIFWFRTVDDEPWLMSLRPSELKCYLVVARAIQRDRNGGKLSVRQIAKRAQINPKHAHSAITELVRQRRLVWNTLPGVIAVFRFPAAFRNCTPTGGQLRDAHEQNRMPTGVHLAHKQGEQHRTPTGEQNCTPTGEQQLESSEFLEKSQSELLVAVPPQEPAQRAMNDRTIAFTDDEDAAVRRHIRGSGIEPDDKLMAALERKATFYGISGYQVASAIERALRNVHNKPSSAPKGAGWFVAVIENAFTSKPIGPQQIEQLAEAKRLGRWR